MRTCTYIYARWSTHVRACAYVIVSARTPPSLAGLISRTRVEIPTVSGVGSGWQLLRVVLKRHFRVYLMYPIIPRTSHSHDKLDLKSVANDKE